MYGNELRVRHVLGDLLVAAMQVTDIRPGVDDLFAVEFEHDAQHPVRARVLRPHVEDHLLAGQLFFHHLLRAGGGIDQLHFVLRGHELHGFLLRRVRQFLLLLRERVELTRLAADRTARATGSHERPAQHRRGAHRVGIDRCFRAVRPGYRRAGNPCATGDADSLPTSGCASGSGVRESGCRTCRTPRARASPLPATRR